MRVGNQASQTIFVTLTLQWHLDPRHHPLSDVANGLLLAYERGGQRGVGFYLVRIRRHQLHAHFATSARAHKVHDADRPRARLRFDDRDAMHNSVHTLMRMARDDEVNRSRIELVGHVQDLAVARSVAAPPGIARRARVRDHDHEVRRGAGIGEIALDRLRAVSEREALNVA